MNEISSDIVSSFFNIKERLEHFNCFKERINLSHYCIKIFYKLWGRKIKNSINYNQFAQEFNKMYFWKNLLKCLIFLDECSLLTANKIYDVGCGAAPASIAYAELASLKGNNVEVVLHDKSRAQLKLAEEFLGCLDIKLKERNENHFIIKDKLYIELVFFSYFLCEQNDDIIKDLFGKRKSFLNGFVVIDYKKNIEKISNYFESRGDNGIVPIQLHSCLTKELYDVIGEKEVTVYGCYYKKER